MTPLPHQNAPFADESRVMVELVPVGPVNPLASQVVAANLHALMGLPTDIVTTRSLPETAYMAARRQYDAIRIINRLASSPPATAICLGLTSADLGTPILTYVFGESQLGGRIALVSLYRLSAEGEEQALNRLTKVSLHEIGHILGLGHCWKPHCLMRSPRNIEYLDEMELDFCESCAFEITRRVHQLVSRDG
jgi:archaemetzincin